ncbi:MAG: rhodanese-like protein [Gemmatimonadetes bacterium]|nr:rhodanese-like protein [Gemmatimonadota bacterium]
MSAPRWTPPRLLAGASAVLGLLALVAGVSDRRAHGTVDVDRLARTVQAEEDHVTALELARWIKERKPGLRVVDVRTADEFAAFHVPTAERLSLPQVVRARFRPDETVVLYSEGGTHAAQGWFFLRAQGLEHVYFLRGGLYEWLQDIEKPVLREDASAAQRAAWSEQAALSRYFGGSPRVGGSESAEDEGSGGPAAAPIPGIRAPDAGGATANAVRRTRAGGC